MTRKKKKKFIWIFALILFAAVLAAPLAVSTYMKASTEAYLITDDAAAELGADCILVLGAGLKADGTGQR